MNLYNRINKKKRTIEKASLRLFLMVRSENNKWQSIICSSPKDAVRAWKSRKKSERDIGVLHVGFDQPSFQDFDGIANQYSGYILITTAAKYTLPASFAVSDKPIAHTGNFAVYLALRGWGYSIQDTSADTHNTFKKSLDWIVAYTEKNPQVVEVLNAHKIYDDDSYLEAEHSLEPILRQRLGLFRTRYLAGENCNDPCKLAYFAPPWLINRKLSSLNIPVKAYNIFERNNIKTIADLANWTSERLLKEPSFGYKTLYHVWVSLNDVLADKSTADLRQTSEPSLDTENRVNTEIKINTSFIQNMKQFLISLNNQEHYALKKYLELETPSNSSIDNVDSDNMTLEEVHKIETAAIKKLKSSIFWHVFVHKITYLLDNISYPMPITRLGTMDSWFKAIAKHQASFKNLIRIMDKKDVYVVKDTRVYYFSVINQSTWDDIVEEAKKLLWSGMYKQWSENEAYFQVHKLLPNNVKSMGYILWNNVSRFCYFNTNSKGVRIFTSYGKGNEHLVKKIMHDSDSPMHYKKIAEIAHTKYQRNISHTSVHSAAHEAGFLFDEKTYGLEKHLPYSNNQIADIHAKIEAIVTADKIKKQWHTNELLTRLLQQLSKDFEGLNEYLLNIILSQSQLLTRCARALWNVKGYKDTGRRQISIATFTTAILKEAGHPLSVSEIKKRFASVRGVYKSFNIPSQYPLVCIQPGIWGINDRDIPLTLQEQQVLIEKLVKQLNKRQSGIHVDEISNILPLKKCSPYTFFSIAVQDQRLKLSRKRYIYMVKWGNPRKKQVSNIS